MIRHVFMWSVSDDADGDAVFKELAELGTLVPGIQNWSAGKQLKTEGHANVGDWQFILMGDFETQEDLDAYQAHPVHAEVLERVFQKYKDWAVVDYEL